MEQTQQNVVQLQQLMMHLLDTNLTLAGQVYTKYKSEIRSMLSVPGSLQLRLSFPLRSPCLGDGLLVMGTPPTR